MAIQARGVHDAPPIGTARHALHKQNEGGSCRAPTAIRRGRLPISPCSPDSCTTQLRLARRLPAPSGKERHAAGLRCSGAEPDQGAFDC